MRVDLSGFIKNKNAGQVLKFGLEDSATRYARPNYAESGHSSVNMAATTFGKSKPDVRDIADQADQTVPSGQEFAPAYDGSGDKAQADGNIPQIGQDAGTGTVGGSAAGTGDGVGPVRGQLWENYRNILGQRESGNNYASVNSIGFCGRWQFGADALRGLGYVKAGYGTRSLRNPNAWTGKDGMTSRKAWLSNSNNVQDKGLITYTQGNYKALLRNKTVDPSMPADQVAGFLAAAHLKGPGGARKFKNGQNNRDAYGTDTASYYNMFAKGKINRTTGFTTAYNSGGPADGEATGGGGGSGHPRTQPDAAAFSFPSSPAAPQYPYNSIKEYEGGHFKEYDSTPGSERIQERHKTGTGYEVIPDGSQRVIVVGSRYTAIMGNDHILINGQCQIIVNGDCGLRVNGNMNHSVSNDYNLHVGGRMLVTVGGDANRTVGGGDANSVAGDKMEIVQGFHSLSVDGDSIINSASSNILAHDGNVNIGATKDINIVTEANLNVGVSGNASLAAKGNFAVSSDAKMDILGKGATTLASTGGKTIVSGSSETTVFSSGPVKLQGSAVNATPKVDRAQWADTGGVVEIAAALGGGPPPPPSPQGSSGAGSSSGDRSENVKNTDKDKIDKAMENFKPFDGDKTQGHSSGIEGEQHGYDKGFQYGTDNGDGTTTT